MEKTMKIFGIYCENAINIYLLDNELKKSF